MVKKQTNKRDTRAKLVQLVTLPSPEVFLNSFSSMVYIQSYPKIDRKDDRRKKKETRDS